MAGLYTKGQSDIKVEGLKELRDLIIDLPKSINKYSVWKTIWKKIGKPALITAQAEAPVSKKDIPYPPNKSLTIQRGTLKKSIGYFTTRSSKKYLGMYLGPRVKGKFQKNKGGYYGAWVEYGGEVRFFGEHTGRDNRFMEKAWKRNEVSMLTNLFKEGKKIIDKRWGAYTRRVQKLGTLGA